jgi:amino acid transporter
MDAPEPPHRTLHRTLTPVEVMFLTFSALSPSMSVFIYGDSILHLAGTGTAAAVLVGGAIAAVMAFLYAELGAAFPEAGGLYPSLVRILGSFWAFPYITMMMLLAPTLIAFAILGFADYVRVLAPGLPQIPVALGCLVLAAAAAMLKVRMGAILTGVFLSIEIAALLILSGVAITHPARSLGTVLLHPVILDHAALSPLTPAALGLAVVTGVFTCGGASWALFFGEELKDAIFNAIVAMVLSYSRLLYATGRDGVWPRPISRTLARLHPGMRSPIAATVVLCVAAVALMLIGEQRLLILSSGENIFEFLMMGAAVLVGRRIGKTGMNFRAPLHPLLPLLALAGTAAFALADWLDPTAGRPSLIVLSVLFLVSLAYYKARGRPWVLREAEANAPGE